MEVVFFLWYVLVFGWLFVIGCAVGSFLNVVIYRLPRGKNLGWPSSRCGVCYTPIPGSLNIPLVSYWRLRGRCFACGATFSMRYFLVELLTGVVFVVLYTLEIGLNLHSYPIWPNGGFRFLDYATFPPHSWQLFIAHAILGSLLIAAVGCLLDEGEVPIGLVVTGVILGLLWSILYPWPTPNPLARMGEIGFVPWPAWKPARWMMPGSLLIGLATGLAGILVVPWLVRLVDAAHTRILGRRVLGDAAAVLMMVGGFLGWQVLLVAVGVLMLMLVLLLLGVNRRHAPNVFAVGLCLTLAWVWLSWSVLGPPLAPWLFHPIFAPLIVLGVGVALFGLGCLLPAQPPSKRFRRSCISSSAAADQV